MMTSSALTSLASPSLALVSCGSKAQVGAAHPRARRLYPDLQHLRAIGQAITQAVWEAAAAEGVAAVSPPANISQVVAAAFWTPSYHDDDDHDAARR